MYADSALSLVAPLCVIILVFITKRVVLSLFVGILVAGFMIGFHTQVNTMESISYSLKYVAKSITSVFYDTNDSSINISSFYLFGFLFILGIITQIISHSGGISAFVKWARNKVKTARSSEFLAFIAGIVIFIDDYFNALTVGQLTKSLNDANNSTRERLAYIIDSTSAPICILMPISSWGAYTLGTMAKLDENLGFFTLLSSVWGNYYAWFALLAVFLTIYWQVNLPTMQRNKNVGVSDFLNTNQKASSNILLLIIPIVSLILFVGFLILYTGYLASNSVNIINMLANTNTNFSLFWGGFSALLVSLVISWRHLDTQSFLPIFKMGIASMIPASLILVFAWSIGPIIQEDLQTGTYLAHLAKQWLEANSLNVHVAIPLVTFLISGFIAFCTGTSWGTFAIMLPIGFVIANTNNVEFSLVMSAVLSGAVYGDHASPISDTTILSATGAGCSVQSHFITQLPYVSLTALIAFISFGIASSMHSLIAGYIVGIILMLGIFWWFKGRYSANVVSQSV